jgi:hypothetical protein
MQTVESVRGAARAPNVSRIPIVALGWSLSLFLALSFVLCVLLGLVVPDFGLHQPWLQFLPGFTWAHLAELPTRCDRELCLRLVRRPDFRAALHPARRSRRVRPWPKDDADAAQALTRSDAGVIRGKGARLADRLLWLCIPIGIGALAVVLLLFGLSWWSALGLALLIACHLAIVWVLVAQHGLAGSQRRKR